MSKSTWDEVLASLPETGFFEVVRHYLGPLETPFHKPDIIKRMEAFFQRPDVLESVLNYIDENDSLILSIIAFQNASNSRRLEDMLSNFGKLQLQDMLRNLEDRMLIWNSADIKQPLYRLTPLGEAVKEAGILGGGCILGKGKPGKKPAGSGTAAAPPSVQDCWLNDNFLTIILAFLNERAPLFRKEGGLRKKAVNRLEELFPGIFADGRGYERLLLAGRGLLAAGLVEKKEELLLPVLPLWKELEGWSPEKRLLYIRTLSISGRGIPAEEAMNAVRIICEYIPRETVYSREHLAVLFQTALAPAFISSRRAMLALSHMELMGLISGEKSGYFTQPSAVHRETGKIIITPSGDITLHPGTPLFSTLALSFQPEKLDITASFHMDKARFQSALTSGTDSLVIMEELEERSGTQIPQNIRTLFNEWEREYNEVECVLYAVLKVQGFRREILESTGILDPWVKEKLPGGIWLLNPEEEEKWRAALEGAGITDLPSLTTPSGSPIKVQSAINREASLRSPILSDNSPPALSRGNWQPCNAPSSAEYMEKLRALGKNIFKTAEEQQAFKERLERRLILVPEQIRPGAWRYEIMMAKGLDYKGKLLLAEAALAGKTDHLALDIADGSSMKTIRVLPLRLAKDGSEHILCALKLPEEKEVQYKIRKIGLLRRIRTSIF